MADSELNDEEIALMCDIAQNSPIAMTPSKQSELDRLIADDFIARRKEEPSYDGYVLTDKGHKTLDDLGVGANES